HRVPRSRSDVAQTLRALSQGIRYKHLKFVILNFSRKWLQNSEMQAGDTSVLRQGLKDTLEAAAILHPGNAPSFSEDDEDEYRDFCTTMLTEKIRVLRALHTLFQAGTERFRQVAGAPKTSLNLDVILNKHLLNAVDQDEMYASANESYTSFKATLLEEYTMRIDLHDKHIDRVEALKARSVDPDDTDDTEDDEDEDDGDGQKVDEEESL
ncbi:hypothetical protein C7974DRAFT_453222, partial [Boeremia exigua]|uniref:uncharacterized protein n=1 Tax=Boeremia exigua TaxID=749465 RepID=UPI001E8EB9B3